ncbi:MAG: hypothetical protein DRI94_11255, partial [Bacteroidetes bacterium]
MHKPKDEKEAPEVVVKTVVVKKDTIVNKDLEYFNATGERKLFDNKRRLWKEGYFENGVLIRGKIYFYNFENEVIK